MFLKTGINGQSNNGLGLKVGNEKRTIINEINFYGFNFGNKNIFFNDENILNSYGNFKGKTKIKFNESSFSIDSLTSNGFLDLNENFSESKKSNYELMGLFVINENEYNSDYPNIKVTFDEYEIYFSKTNYIFNLQNDDFQENNIYTFYSCLVDLSFAKYLKENLNDTINCKFEMSNETGFYISQFIDNNKNLYLGGIPCYVDEEINDDFLAQSKLKNPFSTSYSLNAPLTIEAGKENLNEIPYTFFYDVSNDLIKFQLINNQNNTNINEDYFLSYVDLNFNGKKYNLTNFQDGINQDIYYSYRILEPDQELKNIFLNNVYSSLPLEIEIKNAGINIGFDNSNGFDVYGFSDSTVTGLNFSIGDLKPRNFLNSSIDIGALIITDDGTSVIISVRGKNNEPLENLNEIILKLNNKNYILKYNTIIKSYTIEITDITIKNELINYLSSQSEEVAIPFSLENNFPFVFKIDTSLESPRVGSTNTNYIFHLNTEGENEYFYNMSIDWGDGNVTYYDGNGSEPIEHDYLFPGIYEISISGNYPRLRLGVQDSVLSADTDNDDRKVIDVVNWGDNKWSSLKLMFNVCRNIPSITNAGIPDLSECDDFYRCFRGLLTCTYIESLENYSLSGNCKQIFAYSSLIFQQEPSQIELLKVNKIINAAGMFFRINSITNQNLGSWDTSSFEAMQDLFAGCNFFEGNGLDLWDVRNSKYFNYIFSNCWALDFDITNWDFSSIDSENLPIGNLATPLAFSFSDTRMNKDLSAIPWEKLSGGVSCFSQFNDNNLLPVEFTQDISEWGIHIRNNSDWSGFLTRTTWATELYDICLEYWANSADTGTGIKFGCSTKYSIEQQANKDYLINDLGWTINDDGVNLIDLSSEVFTNSVGQKFTGYSLNQGELGEGFISNENVDPENLPNLGTITNNNFLETGQKIGLFGVLDLNPIESKKYLLIAGEISNDIPIINNGEIEIKINNISTILTYDPNFVWPEPFFGNNFANDLTRNFPVYLVEV